MKALLGTLLILIILLSTLDAQQIDTAAVKQEVLELNTYRSKKEYLKRTYLEDQRYRGKIRNDSIDFRHLISISLYINEYGYPKKQDFGQYVSSPWLIWIHNRYHEIDRISFPIIWKGFQSGEIEEKELRNYYLRGLYQFKSDDADNKTLPLEELLKVCEVSLDDKISIRRIIEAKAEIDKFNSLLIVHESTWKADDTTKTYQLNGNDFTHLHEGQNIKIIEKENGKTYLLNVNRDQSGELRELEITGKNRYKLKDQQTDKYYEIVDGSVLYRNELEILKEYKKCE